jgi:hypothetical protein
MMPDVDFSSSWADHVIEMAQDDDLTMLLLDYESEVKASWEIFKKILMENQNIFPAKFID